MLKRLRLIHLLCGRNKVVRFRAKRSNSYSSTALWGKVLIKSSKISIWAHLFTLFLHSQLCQQSTIKYHILSNISIVSTRCWFFFPLAVPSKLYIVSLMKEVKLNIWGRGRRMSESIEKIKRQNDTIFYDWKKSYYIHYAI